MIHFANFRCLICLSLKTWFQNFFDLPEPFLDFHDDEYKPNSRLLQLLNRQLNIINQFRIYLIP